MKIVASNGECVVVDYPDSWKIYVIETGEYLCSNSKIVDPMWLLAAIAKWGYRGANMTIKSLDEIKGIDVVYDDNSLSEYYTDEGKLK